MKKALKVILGILTVLIAARTLLVSIDYLYKKYGNRYIDSPTDI